MDIEKIGKHVDAFIIAEDLPPSAALKPIRKFDGLYPEDEDERTAYFEFIEWAMQREHAVLLSIPKPVYDYSFQEEEDDAISFAFGSGDFQRLRGEFNYKAYKARKILARVKDLAQTHSCVSESTSKENIRRRYEELITYEFRSEAVELAKKFHEYRAYMDPIQVKEKLGALYRQIEEAKSTWRKHAYDE